jgi:hypothetical protein
MEVASRPEWVAPESADGLRSKDGCNPQGKHGRTPTRRSPPISRSRSPSPSPLLRVFLLTFFTATSPTRRRQRHAGRPPRSLPPGLVDSSYFFQGCITCCCNAAETCKQLRWRVRRRRYIGRAREGERDCRQE